MKKSKILLSGVISLFCIGTLASVSSVVGNNFSNTTQKESFSEEVTIKTAKNENSREAKPTFDNSFLNDNPLPADKTGGTLIDPLTLQVDPITLKGGGNPQEFPEYWTKATYINGFKLKPDALERFKKIHKEDLIYDDMKDFQTNTPNLEIRKEPNYIGNFFEKGTVIHKGQPEEREIFLVNANPSQAVFRIYISGDVNIFKVIETKRGSGIFKSYYATAKFDGENTNQGGNSTPVSALGADGEKFSKDLNLKTNLHGGNISVGLGLGSSIGINYTYQNRKSFSYLYDHDLFNKSNILKTIQTNWNSSDFIKQATSNEIGGADFYKVFIYDNNFITPFLNTIWDNKKEGFPHKNPETSGRILPSELKYSIGEYSTGGVNNINDLLHGAGTAPGDLKFSDLPNGSNVFYQIYNTDDKAGSAELNMWLTSKYLNNVEFKNTPFSPNFRLWVEGFKKQTDTSLISTSILTNPQLSNFYKNMLPGVDGSNAEIMPPFLASLMVDTGSTKNWYNINRTEYNSYITPASFNNLPTDAKVNIRILNSDDLKGTLEIAIDVDKYIKEGQNVDQPKTFEPITITGFKIAEGEDLSKVNTEIVNPPTINEEGKKVLASAVTSENANTYLNKPTFKNLPTDATISYQVIGTDDWEGTLTIKVIVSKTYINGVADSNPKTFDEEYTIVGFQKSDKNKPTKLLTNPTANELAATVLPSKMTNEEVSKYLNSPTFDSLPPETTISYYILEADDLKGTLRLEIIISQYYDENGELITQQKTFQLLPASDGSIGIITGFMKHEVTQENNTEIINGPRAKQPYASNIYSSVITNENIKTYVEDPAYANLHVGAVTTYIIIGSNDTEGQLSVKVQVSSATIENETKLNYVFNKIYVVSGFKKTGETLNKETVISVPPKANELGKDKLASDILSNNLNINEFVTTPTFSNWVPGATYTIEPKSGDDKSGIMTADIKVSPAYDKDGNTVPTKIFDNIKIEGFLTSDAITTVLVSPPTAKELCKTMSSKEVLEQLGLEWAIDEKGFMQEGNKFVSIYFEKAQFSNLPVDAKVSYKVTSFNEFLGTITLEVFVNKYFNSNESSNEIIKQKSFGRHILNGFKQIEEPSITEPTTIIVPPTINDAGKKVLASTVTSENANIYLNDPTFGNPVEGARITYKIIASNDVKGNITVKVIVSKAYTSIEGSNPTTYEITNNVEFIRPYIVEGFSISPELEKVNTIILIAPTAKPKAANILPSSLWDDKGDSFISSKVSNNVNDPIYENVPDGAVTSYDLISTDDTNGTITVKVKLDKAYVKGVITENFTFDKEYIIAGFKTENKPETVNTMMQVLPKVIQPAASEILASAVTSENINTVVSNPKFSDPAAEATITLKVKSYNDIKGELEVTVWVDKRIVNGEIVEGEFEFVDAHQFGQKPIILTGFKTDTNVTTTISAAPTINEAGKLVIASSVTSANVADYLNAPEFLSPVSSATVSYKLLSTNDIDSTIVVKVQVSKAYVSGKEVDNYVFPDKYVINGFLKVDDTKNVNTEIVTGPTLIDANSIKDIVASTMRNETIGQYLNEPTFKQYPESAKHSYIINKMDDETGTITLNVSIDKYYENGDLINKDKIFTNNYEITGFKKVPKNDINTFLITLPTINQLGRTMLASNSVEELEKYIYPALFANVVDNEVATYEERIAINSMGIISTIVQLKNSYLNGEVTSNPINIECDIIDFVVGNNFDDTEIKEIQLNEKGQNMFVNGVDNTMLTNEGSTTIIGKVDLFNGLDNTEWKMEKIAGSEDKDLGTIKVKVFLKNLYINGGLYSNSFKELKNEYTLIGFKTGTTSVSKVETLTQNLKASDFKKENQEEQNNFFDKNLEILIKSRPENALINYEVIDSNDNNLLRFAIKSSTFYKKGEYYNDAGYLVKYDSLVDGKDLTDNDYIYELYLSNSVGSVFNMNILWIIIGVLVFVTLIVTIVLLLKFKKV